MSDAPLTQQPPARSRPPTLFERGADCFFRGLTRCIAWLSVGLLVFFVFEIGSKASPAIQEHGLGMLTSTEWAPSEQEYGILPHIWGTVFSSVLGLLIGS